MVSEIFFRSWRAVHWWDELYLMLLPSVNSTSTSSGMHMRPWIGFLCVKPWAMPSLWKLLSCSMRTSVEWSSMRRTSISLKSILERTMAEEIGGMKPVMGLRHQPLSLKLLRPLQQQFLDLEMLVMVPLEANLQLEEVCLRLLVTRLNLAAVAMMMTLHRLLVHLAASPWQTASSWMCCVAFDFCSRLDWQLKRSVTSCPQPRVILTSVWWLLPSKHFGMSSSLGNTSNDLDEYDPYQDWDDGYDIYWADSSWNESSWDDGYYEPWNDVQALQPGLPPEAAISDGDQALLQESLKAEKEAEALAVQAQRTWSEAQRATQALRRDRGFGHHVKASGGEDKCFICGSGSHYARDCPDRQHPFYVLKGGKSKGKSKKGKGPCGTRARVRAKALVLDSQWMPTPQSWCMAWRWRNPPWISIRRLLPAPKRDVLFLTWRNSVSRAGGISAKPDQLHCSCRQTDFCDHCEVQAAVLQIR